MIKTIIACKTTLDPQKLLNKTRHQPTYVITLTYLVPFPLPYFYQNNNKKNSKCKYRGVRRVKSVDVNIYKIYLKGMLRER